MWDEYPHAVEYLVYAYLQICGRTIPGCLGASSPEHRDLEPTFKTRISSLIDAARYAGLERRDWSAAVEVVPRTPVSLAWVMRFLVPEGIAQFSSGLGAVAPSYPAAARAAEAPRHARARES